MLLASADQQWLSMAAAAASIYSIKYEASLVTRSLYFHLGWLEGWHETFFGWLQPPHATPVEPPLLLINFERLNFTFQRTYLIM